ncbi:MAG: radical SAM protein [Nitrospirae bacterium]|nr:radical SAM protein [Nitrospirota bacterium]
MSYIPLKTYQGLSIDELKTLINGRDIYIWGCGHLGRIIKRYFDKNGLTVKAFCDINPKLKITDNLKVINPKEIFNSVRFKKAFIMIASVQHKDAMEKDCLDAGLLKNNDYLSYVRISRPEVAIDVAGKCNVRCSSCPHGNMENLRPEGYMTAAVYKRVLNKLLTERPSLMNIELFTWGEPFLNPDLPEIIQMTEKLVPCTVATNLQTADILEDVIKAEPSQLIISTNGYKESYETGRIGASWKLFFDNLHLLKELIDKYNPKTQVAVLYHLYRNNQKQDLDDMRNLCLGLGLRLYTTWAYLNPYDKILDYCEGRDIGLQAKSIMDILPCDLNHALEFAKADAQKPCLCQRIFPIINWDLSVSLCHTYYGPVIANNFLDISLNELVNLRHHQAQCEICQKHGLHRLDIEVLLKKYHTFNMLINS